MDPITILATVGTTLQIVKEVWERLQWMYRVYETFVEGDKTLRLMAIECSIYGESIKTIGRWLKKSQTATGLTRQMRTTHNAITLIQVSMANVLLDLKKFQDSGNKISAKDKMLSSKARNIKMFQQFIIKKAKLQWFQEMMKCHLVELRAHGSLLHMTLGVIELTGHNSKTPEAVPEKLDNQTGKLERRLLLRQFITKALDMKRAQDAELAKRDEPKDLSTHPSPGSWKKSPQKLTFYDVVQLARQQALAEKTRRLSEDLIDFTDTTEPVLSQAPLISSQCDLELLNLSNPVPAQMIDPLLPSRTDSWTPVPFQIPELTSDESPNVELDATTLEKPPFTAEMASNQSLIVEMDTSSSEKPPSVAEMASDQSLIVELDTSSFEKSPSAAEITSNQCLVVELDDDSSEKLPTVNPLQPLELQISQSDSVHEKDPNGSLTSPEVPNELNFQLDLSREVLNCEDRDAKEKPVPLGSLICESSTAGCSDEKVANIPCASPASQDWPSAPIQRSDNSLIDLEDDVDGALSGISTPKSAAPSIFSHSSSLTSATCYSLPAITEEDVQARNSLSRISPKASSPIAKPSPPPGAAMISCIAGGSIPEAGAPNDDAELCMSQCTSSTSKAHMGLDSSLKLQRTQSGGSVSLAQSLPQLSDIDEPDEQGFPWIVQAARDGNEQIIRKLLVSGADVKASHTSTRRHALLEASIQGHQKIVDLLIEEGCPLEHADAEGYTALHHACKKGHLTIAKSLINSGSLLDALGPQGQTALHLAIRVPYQNVVMLLIQHKANVNARDATFQTPLHIGAIQGNTAMCTHLLNESAQLDSRDAQSKTALQIACEAGHYELVQMMLNQSKLKSTNMTFLSAFFAAVEYGHVRIAESFFSHGLKLHELKNGSHKPVTLAAKSGSLAMVELMIQEDCNTNARDENGWNALHFASHHGHYQVIERLLASNISSIATTTRKETSLLLAVKRGHFAVAERLLRDDKVSALVSTEDEQGQQPVHHAVRAGLLEIFNLLMSNGAKINVENSFGWQPLHVATAYGHLTLVERLLQEGSNIEARLDSTSTKKDQTHKVVEEGYWAEARWPYPGSRPLHLACEYGHDQIADYFISKGAKMEASCNEGWQPLHHAAYFGSSALVSTLLEGGVNPHATTDEGKTAQALQFCTSGALILEEEKDRIQNLLKKAMGNVRKQKSFKVALKRGSTVEEKNKLVRAATFSMSVVSRPQSDRALSSLQTSDPASTPAGSASSLQRPPMPHLPHTSPLPITDSKSVLNSPHPPTPQLPFFQERPPTLPTTTDPNPIDTDPSASKPQPEEPLPATTIDHLPPQSSNAHPSPDTTLIAVNNSSTQVSTQPEPKLKRRSTFGLGSNSSSSNKKNNSSSSSSGGGGGKEKSSLDIGKLSLVGNMSMSIGIGKPAFELGKQTRDIGKQTLELGKQTRDIGKQTLELGKHGLDKSGRMGLEAIQGGGSEIKKQGVEMGKQGLEMGKQGLDIGKQGIDMGRQGFRRAKTFAVAKGGKMGIRRGKGKGKAVADDNNNGDDDESSSKAGDKSGREGVGDEEGFEGVGDDEGNGNDNDGNDGNDGDDGDDDDDDDKASQFSLGEFADLGNSSF